MIKAVSKLLMIGGSILSVVLALIALIVFGLYFENLDVNSLTTILVSAIFMLVSSGIFFLLLYLKISLKFVEIFAIVDTSISISLIVCAIFTPFIGARVLDIFYGIYMLIIAIIYYVGGFYHIRRYS